MAPRQEKTKCRACGHAFYYTPAKGRTAPSLCGAPACVVVTWGPSEWEGRARMAAARRSAGSHLDPIDHQALAKYPEPSPIPTTKKNRKEPQEARHHEQGTLHT